MDGDVVWTYSADSIALITQSSFKTLGLWVDSIGNVYFSYPRKISSSYSITHLHFNKLSTNGQLMDVYIETPVTTVQ